MLWRLEVEGLIRGLRGMERRWMGGDKTKNEKSWQYQDFCYDEGKQAVVIIITSFRDLLR